MGSGLTGWVIAVWLVFLSAWGLAATKSYQNLQLARHRSVELRGEIHSTNERIVDLRQRISDLGSSPAAQERVARRELGWLRPDEIVIVLPPDGKSSGPEDHP